MVIISSFFGASYAYKSFICIRCTKKLDMMTMFVIFYVKVAVYSLVYLKKVHLKVQVVITFELSQTL